MKEVKLKFLNGPSQLFLIYSAIITSESNLIDEICSSGRKIRERMIAWNKIQSEAVEGLLSLSCLATSRPHFASPRQSPPKIWPILSGDVHPQGLPECRDMSHIPVGFQYVH